MSIQPSSIAIPFISLQNQKFTISSQAQSFLKSLQSPLAIVTIVGKYRTGKSLFLNKVILNKSKTFKVSPTINSCTKGLWLWKDTIKVQGQDKEILIIDTEGFGATEETDAYNNRILLFALLLSSYFVYNSVGSIDQNSLNNISVIANLANEIQSKNTKDQNIDQHFPSFLWLVRDFTLNLVDKNDIPIQPKQYLEQALQIQKGSSTMIQGKNRIRRMMKHFFKDRDCFTMLRPVETEDKLQQLDSLEEGQFRPAFLEQIKTLRQKIFKKIKVKKLKNAQLSGQTFFQLAKDYVQVINNNSLPNFESSYKHLLKIQSSNLKKQLISQEQKKIKLLIDENLKNLQTTQQFQAIKHKFICSCQQSLKSKLKNSSSLSTISTQEAYLLTTEIKQKIITIFDQKFKSKKQQLRSVGVQIVNKLRQDNLMGDRFTDINNQQQFRHYITQVQKQFLIQCENQCGKLFSNQFLISLFQPYKQQALQQYIKAINKKSTQNHNQLKSKLLNTQTQLNNKSIQTIKLQKELQQQKYQNNKNLQKITQIQTNYQKYKQIKISQIQELKQFIKQQKSLLQTRQQQIIKLKNQVKQKCIVQQKLSKNLSQQKQQINYHQRQILLTKCSLQNKTQQIQQKNQFIQSLKHDINLKDNKYQSLLIKLQSLRQTKQGIYSQFIKQKQTLHTKISQLQKIQTKLSTQLKQTNKNYEKYQQQSKDETKCLKQKCQKDQQTIKELMKANQSLIQGIKGLQERMQHFINKQKNLKQYKKCMKNSSSIQCQHCTRFFMSTIFITHLSVCTAFNQSNQDYIPKQVINVAINQNNGKPYTKYQIQCRKGDKLWKVQKRFTELCDLKTNLQTILPGIQLSQASIICEPQSLNRNSISLQQKQHLIQKYLNDLSHNTNVIKTKYWLEFINANNSILKQNSSSLNYEMLNRKDSKLQLNDKSILKFKNNKGKQNNVQSPQEFFKIWEQKQQRSKATSVCLRKGKQNL